MEALKECSICMMEYDTKFHYPLVLTCGHNICSASSVKLYLNKQIKCPFCKKINVYAVKEDISKNFALIEMISHMTSPTHSVITIQNDEDIFEHLLPIEQLIADIAVENAKIKETFQYFFNGVKEYQEDVL